MNLFVKKTEKRKVMNIFFPEKLSVGEWSLRNFFCDMKLKTWLNYQPEWYLSLNSQLSFPSLSGYTSPCNMVVLAVAVIGGPWRLLPLWSNHGHWWTCNICNGQALKMVLAFMHALIVVSKWKPVLDIMRHVRNNHSWPRNGVPDRWWCYESHGKKMEFVFGVCLWVGEIDKSR